MLSVSRVDTVNVPKLNSMNIPILNQRKGFYISFDGLDGSGKGCQIDLLRQAMQKTGFKVTVVREPGSSSIGEKLRDILKDTRNKNMCFETELLLMNAGRAQLIKEIIEPALKDGHIVISDRSFWSSIIYQGFGRRLNLDVVKAIIQFSVGDTIPDVSFVLDISKEEADRRKKNRGTSDRFEQEDVEFQDRVRAGFDRLKGLEQASKGKIVAIEASGSPEMIHTEIYRCVAARISVMKEGSLIVNEGKKIIV